MRNRAGSLSSPSSDSQATGTFDSLCPRSPRRAIPATHSLSSVVLPKPAGAEMSEWVAGETAPRTGRSAPRWHALVQPLDETRPRHQVCAQRWDIELGCQQCCGHLPAPHGIARKNGAATRWLRCPYYHTTGWLSPQHGMAAFFLEPTGPWISRSANRSCGYLDDHEGH